ncbi:helix-turn-helix domain-containing protein [Kitasatospora terrestris]|uniref:Helix-turn-helix domain-containing protein n=1 Tax=Kitasatospora terrestris TaxID=258051 RepID=A0ABP9E071_9ACTN
MAPRRDTRGILDAAGLLSLVRFRRREAAEPLRRYVEHYWLIDWDLPRPYTTRVLPHPSVNLVLQRYGDAPAHGELTGIAPGVFRQRLAGTGRVCGVQFRPGGFGPFARDHPVSHWTGRRVPLPEALPGTPPAATVTGPADEDDRVAALDALLLGLRPEPDPDTDLAVALAERIRTDRTLRRVADLAADAGLSVRALQRLFARQVGVGPKWVILRHRIHEAIERAETGTAVDWAALAHELGYSDQAHLTRDFTATLGVPPTAYAGGWAPPAASPTPRGRSG